jgi:NAD(P)H-dependent flavin oxidoreductase YrpB (nitropropane dioxygenase family)
MTLVPMLVDAVAPTPVLAADGIADGRGLAAAIAIGADGVLLGTRFLASRESPLHPNFKQAILESDGHDTLLSEIPDIAASLVWPGAMSRSRRNRFIERWAGRNGHYVNTAPKHGQRCKWRARMATPKKRPYRWVKMRD